jgi:transcription-repair coupling factor (superfamily II helicase)
MSLHFVPGQRYKQDKFIRHLNDIQYDRNDIDFHRGTFRVRGDVIDIFTAGSDLAVRVEFFGDVIDRLTTINPLTGEILETPPSFDIFPNSHYATPREIVVLDSANMMIHTANFGSVGSTGNVKAHTDFTVKQVETLLDDAYAGFLHKDELAKVKAGVELWFDSTQIRERIGTRVKHLEAQQAAKAAAEEKEAKPKRSRKTT